MNPVETILLENAGRSGAVFVFPTDVAASRWADQALRLSDGGAVAMNRFIAWDTFKGDSIRSRKQGRRSIPRPLRTIFVSRLIRENAERLGRGEAPVFTSLIRGEWADQAGGFTGWLAGLLPQLGSWFSKTTGLPAAQIAGSAAAKITAGFEGDDRDLYTFALRYAQFLEAHGLFEPAWETPPFDDTGREYFIFFPESLSDYSEYRELLESSGHVRPVRAPESGGERSGVFFYTNSRSEIAEAALYIRALHEREGVPWDSIVVSIPGAEAYEPYVLREFVNRNIPFVSRTGKPLAEYPAGRFFSAVADCAARGFAFSALAGLLLNRRLPWKDGAVIQSLIDFGINNNCITSWVEETDKGEQPVNVWEDALANPLGGIDPEARQFFSGLKRRIAALRGAASFAELRKQYFSFRERFFDMDQCLPETDLVLSRCVSELMGLVELEKDFPGVPAPDPFMFFVEYLGELMYLAQQPDSGVVILPYRTAAPAPFECHVILGASQDNLSAVFTRLGFLPRGKREKLGAADEDASAAFINLHQFNSRRPAAFFCSEHTFSGYAIPHSRLGTALKARQRYGEDGEYAAQFSADLYRAESAFYASLHSARQGGGAVFPPLLHENQKRGFEEWRSRRQGAVDSAGKWEPGTILPAFIRERFCGEGPLADKLSVSASSLQPYYRCSLQWLFERAFGLANAQVEAGLMDESIPGLVYHAALNLFFTELKESGAVLLPPVFSAEGRGDVPALPAQYRELLGRSLDTVFASLPRLPPRGRQEMSALTARLLRAERGEFHERLENCLAVFLAYFSGHRVIGSETVYRAERDSYFLNGTVDCMLEDLREDSENSGATIIVDFKLRRLPDRDDCTGEGENGLAHFQLPMYLNLAEENEGRPVHTALFFSVVAAEPEVVFGTIRHVKTGDLLPKKEAQRIDRESGRFQQVMNEFEEKTGRFAAETGSAAFSVFDPGNEQCGGCAYHRVCRTMYKIGREHRLESWGSAGAR